MLTIRFDQLGLRRGDRVLDVGAGFGRHAFEAARRGGRVVALDYAADEVVETRATIEAMREAGEITDDDLAEVLRGDATRLPFPDGSFDVVITSEVLEHIHDDVAALRRWSERSRRWLLLSVPMNPRRFAASDEYAGHYRRYSAATLTTRLVEGGWEPRALAAYGFPLGYGLEAVRNVLAARRMQASSMGERTKASGRWLQPPPAIGALTWAAALPFRLAQRPFAETSRGTGLVALAERPGAMR